MEIGPLAQLVEQLTLNHKTYTQSSIYSNTFFSNPTKKTYVFMGFLQISDTKPSQQIFNIIRGFFKVVAA